MAQGLKWGGAFGVFILSLKTGDDLPAELYRCFQEIGLPFGSEEVATAAFNRYDRFSQETPSVP